MITQAKERNGAGKVNGGVKTEDLESVRLKVKVVDRPWIWRLILLG